MAFSLVGIGLNPPKDITLAGLECIHGAKNVYIEVYTNRLQLSVDELGDFLKKRIIPITRTELEESEKLVKEAKKTNIALLVLGDPLFATTHIELLQRMRAANVKFRVLHNASVLNAILDTGLQGYKFGRTVSLPRGNPAKSVYEGIKHNREIGLHTLILLDVYQEGKGLMTVKEAVELLLKMEQEFKGNDLSKTEKWVGCSSLGLPDAVIRYATPSALLTAKFSEQPHCLIIPGKLHFMEEETLNSFA